MDKNRGDEVVSLDKQHVVLELKLFEAYRERDAKLTSEIRLSLEIQINTLLVTLVRSAKLTRLQVGTPKTEPKKENHSR